MSDLRAFNELGNDAVLAKGQAELPPAESFHDPAGLSGTAPAGPRLLDRVRGAIRARHYSPRTEKAYVWCIKRYIFFHGEAASRRDGRGRGPLLFLYREVLGRQLAGLEATVRAKRPVRLPVVLSRRELAAVLSHLHGTVWLMASLMYGAGLRLLECARIRVKDVDFPRREITVRDGKGRKDRVTVLPAKCAAPLQAHLERVRHQHEADLRGGAGSVALPDALERKYPSAACEWGWQWAFPATRFHTDGFSGQRRRHHLHESVVQRAFKDAVRAAGLAKPAGCHALAPLVRHSSPGCRL